MKDSKAVEVNRRHSILTFRWLGLITILLAFRASMAGQGLRIQLFHQLTPSQGWALINNHLLATRRQPSTSRRCPTPSGSTANAFTSTQGGHNETWGGVTFNIDRSSTNGQVAAPTGFVSPACTT